MSKSEGNAIFLADDPDTLAKKVRSMYTDPTHIHLDDPGHIEGNTVFTYLDVFAPASEQAHVAELKEHYQAGGLGDVKVKNYLLDILEGVLGPIRSRREEYAKDPAAVYEILRQGTAHANEVAQATLAEVRHAMKIDYFG
jgi:tryptophanyl-tRNA synthetase